MKKKNRDNTIALVAGAVTGLAIVHVVTRSERKKRKQIQADAAAEVASIHRAKDTVVEEIRAGQHRNLESAMASLKFWTIIENQKQ